MTARATRSPSADEARRAWAAMCDLVLDNQRRREVSDAVGLSFARVRALRRIAPAPITMGALAAALVKVRAAISTATTTARAEQALRAGYEHVVDLSRESLRDGVMRMTGDLRGGGFPAASPATIHGHEQVRRRRSHRRRRRS